MSQQINLYQPMFRQQRKIFSAVTIVQLAGIFVVGLALIYGFGRYQVAVLGDQVAALETQRDAAMRQLETLSGRSRPATRSGLLDEQLREARAELDAKQRMLRAFENRRFGNTDGFSEHFAGLARQRVDGLWLTRVEIRDGGVAFDGATESAELLPRYIAHLGRERAFAGSEFARLRMARGEAAGAPIEFSVSSRAEETAR